MGRASNKKKGRLPGNKEKGKLVEGIVAMFHDDPNVKVERNVELIGRTGTTPREIDVLITAGVAGHEVQVAFECKNEGKPIGVGYIDAFRGKLDYLDIPRKHGVFVSASGYTKGALEAAADASIKVLTLKGLTKDRLASIVLDAFQHVVYLLATISLIQVTNEIDEVNSPYEQGELISFKDKDGLVCGAVPDLIWNAWIRGKIPSELGEHELDISVPQHWYYTVAGKEEKLLGVSGKVEVTGIIVSIRGKATQHALLEADNNSVFKANLSSEFDTSPQTLPVKMVKTQEELNNFIGNQENSASVNITVGSFRLPRVVFNASYYPPSERVARIMISGLQAFQEGKGPDPRPFKFEELEGTDLARVFEPIWSQHPAARKGDWINWISE